MSEHSLALLGDAYLVANFGAFAFLVVLEGGRDALAAHTDRWSHVLRNLGLFASVLVVTDGIVLGWWLGVPSLLTFSDGLFTPLALSPLAQCAAGFVVVDLVDYGFHRLSHRWRWLWLLHAVHHSDPQVDASTAVRFHPVEASLEMVLTVGVLLALGLPLWVEGARAIVYNPLSLFQHANIAYPAWIERALAWLLVTPAMHRQHHSVEPRETHSNFGTVLSVWDRLFGTYVAPTAARPERYGLPNLGEPRWQSLGGMLLTPVRARTLATL